MNELNGIEQCVGFFTNGGAIEWIGGGLIVALSVFGFFKKSFPSAVKDTVKVVYGKIKNKQ